MLHWLLRECLLCPECKLTELGREYMGTLSTTVNGRTCQAWASNTTHQPNSAAQNDANYPDGSRVAARNYCRNPDSDPVGPWCYTTDPEVRFEPCYVPYCGTSNDYSTLCIYLFIYLFTYLLAQIKKNHKTNSNRNVKWW